MAPRKRSRPWSGGFGLMPSTKSTGAAPAFLPLAFGCASAAWTRLLSALGEVLAVLLAMALLTQCLAVIDGESQAGVSGPVFDVVSVDVPCRATSTAGVPVSRVDSGSPFLESVGLSGAFVGEAVTALPCRSLRADHVGRRAYTATVCLSVALERSATRPACTRIGSGGPARLGTVDGGAPLVFTGGSEFFAAVGARDNASASQAWVGLAAFSWRSVLGPAGSRAESLGERGWPEVIAASATATETTAPTALTLRIPTGADIDEGAARSTDPGIHARIIPIDPRYVDVIRRRWTRWAKDNGQDPGSGALDG